MVYLGVGSNLSSTFGNRFKNINLAITALKEKNINIIKKSSFYETLAYPNKNDPKFINIVIGVETHLSPNELMKNLIFIEEKLQRKRNKKNDPRTCDIDIIDYKRKIINFNFNNLMLQIPHQSMTKRSFVLHPLKEICPTWTHPITKKTIDILIRDLKIDNNDITKLSQNDIRTYDK